MIVVALVAQREVKSDQTLHLTSRAGAWDLRGAASGSRNPSPVLAGLFSCSTALRMNSSCRLSSIARSLLIGFNGAAFCYRPLRDGTTPDVGSSPQSPCSRRETRVLCASAVPCFAHLAYAMDEVSECHYRACAVDRHHISPCEYGPIGCVSLPQHLRLLFADGGARQSRGHCKESTPIRWHGGNRTGVRPSAALVPIKRL